MNSFRFLERGINAEIARQEALLRAGEQVVQETLHFDPRRSGSRRCAPRRRRTTTATSRSPTSSRSRSPRRCSRRRAPRCRSCRRPARRASQTLGVSAANARQLAWRTELGDYFEAALAADGADAQPLANWVCNELVARVGEDDPATSKVEPAALAQLVALVAAKAVTVGNAKVVLDRLVPEGGDPARIVEAEGLGAMGGGDDALAPIVEAALAANADVADRIKDGNMKAIGAIIGHVMRETKGRADGGEVTRIVREQLGV